MNVKEGTGIPITPQEMQRIFPNLTVKHKKSGIILFVNEEGLKGHEEEFYVLNLKTMQWEEGTTRGDQ